jgi:hypothetical protein
MGELAAGPSGYFQPNPSMVLEGDGYYSTGDLVPASGKPGYYVAEVEDPTMPRLRFVPAGNGFPPGVDVVIQNLGGADSATLFRFAGGRQFEVRSAVRVPVAGALSRLDWEAPAGLVTYRAQLFSASGVSLGFTASASIEVELDRCWVHNPLDPTGAVAVMLQDNSARSLSRPVQGETFFPLGRRAGVVVSGVRSGLRGVTLDMVTDTVADANRVRELVGSYSRTTVPVLCLRLASSDRVRIPSPFFGSALDIVEVDMNYNIGGTQIAHQWESDEVSPPAPSLLVPLLSRADLDAAYSTRAARDADNASRLILDRRFDLIGRARDGLARVLPPRKVLDARFPSRAVKDASQKTRSAADRPADLIVT